MKITRIYIPALFFLFLTTYNIAQDRGDIGVKQGNTELTMPWTGGYNAPQFANIDFNRDGITDLISFDRQGDILIPYIHLPASGRWVVDWSYASIFPKIVDWIQIVDYNHDGVEDIFTSSSPTGIPGITVYKGAYENGEWSFTIQEVLGQYYLQVPSQNKYTNLYVSWDDIPAVTDVDGDGDMDILSYGPDGSYIQYSSNNSVENGWGSDSLRYIIADFCWGKILENQLNQEVYLSDNPDVCSDGHFTGDFPIRFRHQGSTIMAFDIEDDGDKDVLVGDIQSPNIVFLLNGLNADHAWIVQQDVTFPSEDSVVNISYFLGSYNVQLDDDPELELLVAVNSRGLAEDKTSVWRYDDDPVAGPLNYKLTEKGSFQNQMIDVGSHSQPAFADINGDGLLDLLIGGYHYTEGCETRVPSIWLYQNVGTASHPFFEFSTDDYLSMSQYNTCSNPTFDFAPAFGDIDGNGTIDLIIGEQNGKLFFYKNTALPGHPVNYISPVYPYMNIAVGVSSTPQIFDVNRDGLGDLIIGERTGNADVNGRCSNLNYFENLGSAGNAVFNADLNTPPNTPCYGRVLFDIPIGLPQYSAPYIVQTDNGAVLIAGGDPGKLYLYSDLEEGKTGSLSPIDNELELLQFGMRSTPALADLNGDGKYEIIVGNQRGGLELFQTSLLVGTTGTTGPIILSEKPYQVMYSLNENIVEIVWKTNDPGQIELFDTYGRSLDIEVNQDEIIQHINLAKYPPGIYFIRLEADHRTWVEKIVNRA